MIYFPQTRVHVSQEFPVAAGFSVAAEGQALVGVTDGGVFGVKPSTGAANEVFVGVAVSQQITITSKTRVERHIVPVSLTITLDRTPQSGQLSVYNHTTGAVVPAGSGGWSIAGNVLTLPSIAGNEISVYYRYAVTANESRALQGDIFPGGAAGFVVNQVGVFKNGTVFTDQFDPTVDWNASNPVVRCGANGQFTIGGTGTIVDCTIVQVPSADSAFLGLNLNY